MRNSIRTRLSIIFISLATLPLLLVGSLLSWQSFIDEQQQALHLQGEIARRIATEVTAFFEGLENELRFVSKSQRLPDLSQEEQQNLLTLLMAQDVYDDLVLLDSGGQEQIHFDRLGLFSDPHSHSPKSDEFVVPQNNGQIYYSPVRFEESTGEPLLTIAVPLLDIRTGLPDGVLIADLRIKKIWDLIADIRTSPGQSVHILDAQGNVIAHRNPSVVLRDTRVAIPKQNGIQSGLTGKKAVLAFETLRFGEQIFHVVAEQKASEAFAFAIKTLMVTAALIVVTLIIAGGLSFLSVRRIVRPIQALASTAEIISAGDLSQQVAVSSQDELGVLARAFNSMTMQLRKIIIDLEGQIAERQQAEKALRETTEELDRFFSVALDLLCIADTDGYFRRLNPQWEAVLGYSLAELEGRRFLELVHPEDRPNTLAVLNDLHSQQTVLNFVNRYRCKDGSYRWIEWRSSPVGTLVYSAAHDITERKQAVDALRESEQKFRAVAQNAQAIIFIVDNHGIFQLSEGQELTKLGLAPGQVVGQSAFELYKAYPPVLESMTKSLAGEPIHTTNVVQDVAFDTVYSPYYDLQGEQIGAIGIAIDVTERRRAELKLQERNRLIDTILENAPIGFALNRIDDGQLIFMNKEFESIYGMTHKTAATLGDFFNKAFADPVVREQIRGNVLTDSATADPSQMRWENVPFSTMNGEHKFTTGIIIPLWEQDLMIVTVQDVTGRKEAEDEIRRLNTELEARVMTRTSELEFANRELKDFAYVVSHDLKAPLRAISRLASWLRNDYDSAFDDQGHEMVELLIGRVKRMDNLIDGILEYSRIGRMETARFPVDLSLLVRDVLDTLAPPEHIRITVEEHLPTLAIEKTRIFQVFQNLIGNAIKFNDKAQGNIELRCVEEETAWKFCVMDNGPGIDPKYHEQIFQIFQTLHSRDEVESTGIGLAIVKKIVKRHGGTIWLESAAGEGCRFFFTLAKTDLETETPSGWLRG